MTGRSVFARAAELEAAGRPFAVATVVAVRRPTSARPGATGLVHPDGTIEGWVGGSCAQPVVVREALRSLADGQPRLLRLSKDAPAEGRRGDGVIELVMTCHSGGTLEIYVEPHLPAPVLWVAGTTPIAGALATLGAAAGWRVTVIDPVAEAEAFPAAERVLTGTDLAAASTRTSPRTSSSRRRASGTRRRPASALSARRRVRRARRVADAGRRRPRRGCARRPTIADERLAALRAPAGHRPRAPRPPRRSPSRSWPSSSRSAAAGPTSSPRPARRRVAGGTLEPIALEPVVDDIVLLDPVCGMTVERAHARHLAEHDGVVYAFCSIGCRTRFIKEPTAFLPASVSLPD